MEDGAGLKGGVLLNLTLGQGDILVTPLQSLRYINHIASKGKTAKLKLNINKKVEYYDDIILSEQTWDRVIKGLYDVVNAEGGSGWRAKQSEVKLYGKTSTAENPHGDLMHGLTDSLILKDKHIH